MNTLENAVKLMRENNYKITEKVCKGLAKDCRECCLSKWQYQYCGIAPSADYSEFYSMLLKKVRKQKLEKLLK